MKSNAREEISNRINIVDLIGQYVTLKRAGTKYVGLCPFHNEKTPSFSVTPERNLFYCFGCHKGGTIFDFVMEMENMTFPEALKFLGKKAGVEVNDRYENSGDNKKREALKELYRRVAGSFHYILKTSGEAEVARAYLKLRGLTDDVVEKFQIGWAPVDRSWLRKFLTEKGYSKDFLEESGIFHRAVYIIRCFLQGLCFRLPIILEMLSLSAEELLKTMVPNISIHRRLRSS